MIYKVLDIDRLKVRKLILIIFSMLFAFFLQGLFLDSSTKNILPEWPFLFALYFTLSLRYSFGLWLCFLVGFLQDFYFNVPILGIYTFIYLLSSFIILLIQFYLSYKSVIFQSLFIGSLVLLKILIIMFYEGTIYIFSFNFIALLSIPLSILSWGAIKIIYDNSLSDN